MQDNPFASMVQAMREEGGGRGLQILEGTVTALSPLTVSVAGIMLSGSSLRVSAVLLSHSLHLNGEKTTVIPDLKPGDTLCLLTSDEQLFYVLCKVVSP